MKSTTIYVEIKGFLYGCHLSPSGRIICGACGRGTVKSGKCDKCDAIEQALQEAKQ